MYCMSAHAIAVKFALMNVHILTWVSVSMWMYNCASACTKQNIQYVMQLHSCEGPCKAMVLQSASVTVGSSAPLRVLATGSVSEPVRADKDTSSCLTNAAERGGRQARDGSCATARGLEVGHKEIPIWTNPHITPYPTGHCLRCQQPSKTNPKPRARSTEGTKAWLQWLASS